MPTTRAATGTRRTTTSRSGPRRACGSTTTRSTTASTRRRASTPSTGGRSRCTTGSSTSRTAATWSRCRGTGSSTTTRPTSSARRDSRTQDRGQHRVTQHHNRWTDIGQRAPRVRFGDVHVYNNLYEQTEASLGESVPGSPVLPVLLGRGHREQHRRGAERRRAAAVVRRSIASSPGGRARSCPRPARSSTARSSTCSARSTRRRPASSPPTSGGTRPTIRLRGAARRGGRRRRPRRRGRRHPELRHARRDRGPGTFALSDDNGWDTGLRDGDYRVTANLWWGQNATVVKLYEDGVLIGAQSLAGVSPAAQQAVFDVTGQGERHAHVRARRAQSVRREPVEAAHGHGARRRTGRRGAERDGRPHRLTRGDGRPLVGHQRHRVRPVPGRRRGRPSVPRRRHARTRSGRAPRSERSRPAPTCSPPSCATPRARPRRSRSP